MLQNKQGCWVNGQKNNYDEEPEGVSNIILEIISLLNKFWDKSSKLSKVTVDLFNSFIPKGVYQNWR